MKKLQKIQAKTVYHIEIDEEELTLIKIAVGKLNTRDNPGSLDLYNALVNID